MKVLSALLATFLASAAPTSAGGAGNALHVDLDGDGRAETVQLQQRHGEIAVLVQGPTLPGYLQKLSFGVDPARQDAVCGLPVTLKVEKLNCASEAEGQEALEGCKQSARASGIALGDGECDPIHMYWNHDKHQVWWWRN